MKLSKVLPIIALLSIVLMTGCKKSSDPTVQPVVTSTDPINNSKGVGRNMPLTFTFNTAMDPSSINSTTFALKQGSTPIAGTVTYSGMTATFTPTVALAAATVYLAHARFQELVPALAPVGELFLWQALAVDLFFLQKRAGSRH